MQTQKIAAQGFVPVAGTGMISPFADVMIQRTNYIRSHKQICPRCKSRLYGPGSEEIIDLGRRGLWCTGCHT